MAPSFSLVDITLIVASIALAVTLFAFIILWQKLMRIKSLDRELDARALVQEFSQRSRRLEEKLVDQKVRLEILELRQERQKGVPSNQNVVLPGMSQASMIENVGKLPFQREVKALKKGESSFDRSLDDDGASHLVRSEVEALKFVLESGAKGSRAREIQARIGRSREHTARMMKMLFKEGLVERNSEARPFSYRITEKGRQAIME